MVLEEENIVVKTNTGDDTIENTKEVIREGTQEVARRHNSPIGAPVDVTDGRFYKLEPPDCATGDNEYYGLTSKHRLYGTGRIALRTNNGRVMYIPAGVILEFSRFTWRFMRNRRVAAQIDKYRKIFAYRDIDNRVIITTQFLLEIYKVLSQCKYNSIDPKRYKDLYNELWAEVMNNQPGQAEDVKQ